MKRARAIYFFFCAQHCFVYWTKHFSHRRILISLFIRSVNVMQFRDSITITKLETTFKLEISFYIWQTTNYEPRKMKLHIILYIHKNSKRASTFFHMENVIEKEMSNGFTLSVTVMQKTERFFICVLCTNWHLNSFK